MGGISPARQQVTIPSVKIWHGSQTHGHKALTGCLG